MDANLSDASPNTGHGLPIRWFIAALNGKQFKTCLPSRFGWKVTQVILT
jgi:hypothetical protein